MVKKIIIGSLLACSAAFLTGVANGNVSTKSHQVYDEKPVAVEDVNVGIYLPEPDLPDDYDQSHEEEDPSTTTSLPENDDLSTEATEVVIIE